MTNTADTSVDHDHDYDPFGEPPECPSGDGHAWVTGRPIFEDGAEQTVENVEYVTRQCRRCGWHDMRLNGHTNINIVEQ